MGKLDLVPKVLEELGVHAGVPSRRAAPRQAAVVRRRAVRGRGIRAAGQPGLDARLPGALCGARAVRRHGPGARRSRRTSRSAHRSTVKPPLAFFMPVKVEDRRLGPHLGGTDAHQRLRGFHLAAPAPTASSSCRPDRTRSRKALWPASSVVRPMDCSRNHRSTFDSPTPAAARHAGPPDARPAHLGDGSLQLPLPLLHAAGEVPREVPLPAHRSERLDFDEIVRLARVFVRARRAASCASPAASPCCAPNLPDLIGDLTALPRHRRHRAHHQRRAAGQARGRARGRRAHARHREPRHASTRTSSRR